MVINSYEEKIIADKIINYLEETKSFLSQKQIRFDENKYKKTDKRYIGSKKNYGVNRHSTQKDGFDMA